MTLDQIKYPLLALGGGHIFLLTNCDQVSIINDLLYKQLLSGIKSNIQLFDADLNELVVSNSNEVVRFTFPLLRKN